MRPRLFRDTTWTILELLAPLKNHSEVRHLLAILLFIVLVGAGGAGKALAYGGYEKGARVVVANGSFDKEQEHASKVGGKAITLAELEEFHPEEGMILAKTTSVGMKPNTDQTPLAKMQIA
ncbi:hypothetical protein MLD38_039148 [Melastoma candidum]|uniref:Uncharacterized protein n=1 Tax=Melastoma candidum TaxID=119954 RepID=A0ACB9L1Y4_9MYRT|nr:hypothetical protein MLD38_039148 [Melastoma candidum]